MTDRRIECRIGYSRAPGSWPPPKAADRLQDSSAGLLSTGAFLSVCFEVAGEVLVAPGCVTRPRAWVGGIAARRRMPMTRHGVQMQGLPLPAPLTTTRSGYQPDSHQPGEGASSTAHAGAGRLRRQPPTAANPEPGLAKPLLPRISSNPAARNGDRTIKAHPLSGAGARIANYSCRRFGTCEPHRRREARWPGRNRKGCEDPCF